MKIKENFIHNWQGPGKEWWNAREANPKEAESIDVTFRLLLSWEQYQTLCDLILKWDAEGRESKADEPITLDAEREVD